MELVRRNAVQETLQEQSHGAYVPKSLGYRNNQRNLIRFCNQPGVATRAFVTTSTGGPELLSHLAGNRLRQTISIVDLRADL